MKGEKCSLDKFRIIPIEDISVHFPVQKLRALRRISSNALASSCGGVALQFVSRGSGGRGFNLHRIIPSKSDAFHYAEAMRESGPVFVDSAGR